MASYDEILSLLIDAVEGKDGSDFEQSLVAAVQSMGLSDADVSKIEEAFGLLDAIPGKMNQMDISRKEGMSRKTFVSEEMNAVTAGLTRDEKAMILETIVSSEDLDKE